MTVWTGAALGIAIVVAVWLGLLLLTVGLGRLTMRLAHGGRQPQGVVDATTASWIGLATLIALLQVWHLVHPVDGCAVAALGALAAIGWSRLGAPTRFRFGRFEAGAALVLVTMVASQAIGPCDSFDSANYQLALVQWAHDFPIVPGLANLSPFFGHNLAGLLLPALLESGPGAGRSQHFFNSFVVALYLVHLLARYRGSTSVLTAARCVLLVPAVAMIHSNAGYYLTSVGTDVFATLSLLTGWAFWLDSLDRPEEEDASRFASLALFALAACAKPTTLPLAGASILLLLATAWRRRQVSRSIVAGSGLAIGLLATWFVRGGILSGYPLFPTRWLAWPVDWRLPSIHVEGVAWTVTAWARRPGDFAGMTARAGALDWLGVWFRNDLRSALNEVLLPVAIGGIATLVLVIAGIRGRRPTAAFLTPALALVAGFMVWAATAPSTRFGQFLFWAAAATAAAVASSALPALTARSARAILASALLLPIALPGYYAARGRGPEAAATLAATYWTPAGVDLGLHPLPKPEVTNLPICGDLPVNRPIADLAVDDSNWQRALVWAAPSPVTNMLLPGVCTRRGGSARHGFRIDPKTDWVRDAADDVRALRAKTGWPVARLAMHYLVPPEAIARALD